MYELTRKAKQVTDKVVLVGLTPVDETKTMPIPWSPHIFYTNAHIQKYDTALSGVATDENILFIPVSDVIDVNELDDGLHPNAEGHRKLFAHIKGELEKHNVLGVS